MRSASCICSNGENHTKNLNIKYTTVWSAEHRIDVNLRLNEDSGSAQPSKVEIIKNENLKIAYYFSTSIIMKIEMRSGRSHARVRHAIG